MTNANTPPHDAESERREPLVSIVTPGYNSARFVHRLLDSILAQTYSAIEFIFVDDGSTDGTRDAVLAYKERFEARGFSFHYIYKEHGGLSSAINEGIKHATGEYLCWPDSDDFFAPASIQKRVAFLEAHPDYAVVTAEAYIVSEDAPDRPLGMASRLNPNRFDQNHFVQCVTLNTFFPPIAHMARMSAFDEANPARAIYVESSPFAGQNVQMLAPLFYKRLRGFMPEPLGYYVQRSDSNMHSLTNAKLQNEFEDAAVRIVARTLDAIDMPPEERAFYKLLARKSIELGRMQIGVACRDKAIFREGYSALEKIQKENPFIFNKDEKARMRLAKARMGNPLFDLAWRILARLKRRFV